MRQPPLPLDPPAPPGPPGSAGPLPVPARAISPFLDLGAYEALWMHPRASFRRLARLFREHPGALPSGLVPGREARQMAHRAVALLRRGGVRHFGVRVHGSPEYPARLRDARDPIELLTFQGWWNQVEAPAVAVVGTRVPTEEGIRRTRRLVRGLIEMGWTVVSGLAAGIDTAAHETALAAGGATIAVLGTPLSTTYPPENAALQRRLARDFLVVSPVPVVRYHHQGVHKNRRFFPARGALMASLTAATILVEAGDRSGVLPQARAALEQRRLLLILESCFADPTLAWPRRYEALGALRVRDHDDLREALGPAPPPSRLSLPAAPAISSDLDVVPQTVG